MNPGPLSIAGELKGVTAEERWPRPPRSTARPDEFGREQSAAHDHTLRIQAEAAAQLGDARRALEVVGRIRQPEPFAAVRRARSEIASGDRP